MKSVLLILLLGMVLAALALGQQTKDEDSLIKDLKSDNSTIRANAAESLGFDNITRAIDPLIHALKDEDANVREKAVGALFLINDTRAAGTLIQVLKDNDSWVRANAASALGRMRNTIAVDPLIQALKDSDFAVRSTAAASLGVIRDPKAVDPLIVSLTDENSSVRANVAVSLGFLEDTKAVEPLIQALKDDDSHVRTEAAWALGEINDTRAAEPLIQALKDDNWSVRGMAAWTLGEINDIRAVEPLIQSLKDDDWTVRANAAISLGRINDTRAVEPLIQAHKDENENVRSEAKKALTKLGWRQASAQGRPSGMANGSMQGGCHTDPVTGRETCVFPNAMTPIAAVNTSNNNSDKNNNPDKNVQGGCHKDPETGQMICIDTSGDLTGNLGTHVTIKPGSIWRVKEYGPMGNWDGGWVIREDAQTIDASWSGGSITDIIDIKSIEGDQITLYRHGNNGYYTGTISPDGLSMSGTASWYSVGETWTATRSDALGNIGNPAIVGSTNVTQAPSPVQHGSESTPVMIGSDQIKLPDRSSLIETSDWGEVPANQVMVMLKEGKGRTDADRLASNLGGRVVGFFSYIDLYQIETSGTTEAELKDSVAKAKQDPDVELAFPNQQSYPDATVKGKECSPMDDPVYTEGGRGKGYEMIGVQNAWDLIRVSGLPLSKVHVGVVDDGLYKIADEYSGKAKIDTSVPGSELQNSLGKVYDKQGNLKHDFTVVGSHGTGVMNIISANPDNGGITGIASEPLGDKLETSMINYNAPPYGDNSESAPDPNDPTKVAWANGKTYAFGDFLAINETITNGAKIISCSWGNRSTDPNTAAAYKKFFEKMANDHPDVLFVCSAGNDGIAPDGATSFPGGLALPNMITVGNVMNDGTKAKSSNVDNGTSYEVTLAAPGEESVYGFDNKGGIANNWGGTSMATPQVTSAAALLRALNPGLTAAQIKEILAQTARTSVDIDGKKVPAPPELGAGILAIDQAVFKVINDQRIKMHLDPFKDIESALKLARVDLTAKNDPASPNDWKITAEILAMGTKGADVTLDLQGEGAVGGNKRQRLANSGSLTWDITLKDTATIVVKRLDTNGCSSAYIGENPSELGKWTTWQIIGGTKVIGLAISNFYYLINRSGSSMTLTAPPNFRSQDIVGTIIDNTFTGTFKNNDPNIGIYGQTHGRVEITFSSDGKHFTGKMMDKNWGSELEWGGDKVSEIGPSPAPSPSTPIAQWIKGSGSLKPTNKVAEGL